MAALSDDLLYCVFFMTFFVLSQPHQGKSTATEQFYLLESFRKAVSERFCLLPAQIKGILFLLLPLYLYLLQRLIPILLSCAVPIVLQRLLRRILIV